MPEPSWKRLERQVARLIGTERTPLSGSASRHTHSDTLHPKLYIETKQRATSSLHTLFEQVARVAENERKEPVLVIHKKGSRRRLVVIDLQLFLQLYQAGVPTHATSNPEEPS